MRPNRKLLTTWCLEASSSASSVMRRFLNASKKSGRLDTDPPPCLVTEGRARREEEPRQTSGVANRCSHNGRGKMMRPSTTQFVFRQDKGEPSGLRSAEQTIAQALMDVQMSESRRGKTIRILAVQQKAKAVADTAAACTR